MENASKALIMAGGILISLMIIAIVIVFYGNIRELQEINKKSDLSQSVAEFNKYYNAYDKTKLYGSELLSLVNKVDEYNKTEADKDGYKALHMEIKINKAIGVGNTSDSITVGNYTEQTLRAKFQKIESVVEGYSKDKTFSGKKVNIASISGLNTKPNAGLGKNPNTNQNYSELEYYLKEEKGITNSTVVQNILNERNKYISYKNALDGIKSAKFKSLGFDYEEVEGRVKLMKFEQI